MRKIIKCLYSNKVNDFNIYLFKNNDMTYSVEIAGVVTSKHNKGRVYNEKTYGIIKEAFQRYKELIEQALTETGVCYVGG